MTKFGFSWVQGLFSNDRANMPHPQDAPRPVDNFLKMGLEISAGIPSHVANPMHIHHAIRFLCPLQDDVQNMLEAFEVLYLTRATYWIEGLSSLTQVLQFTNDASKVIPREVDRKRVRDFFVLWGKDSAFYDYSTFKFPFFELVLKEFKEAFENASKPVSGQAQSGKAAASDDTHLLQADELYFIPFLGVLQTTDELNSDFIVRDSVWVCWVFPTTKMDPRDQLKTSVQNVEQAKALLADKTHRRRWTLILKFLRNVVKNPLMSFKKPADRERISEFLTLWTTGAYRVATDEHKGFKNALESFDLMWNREPPQSPFRQASQQPKQQIELVKSFYDGTAATSYQNMMRDPKYDRALFVFNDNEEQHRAYREGQPEGFAAGRGNAIVRPYRAPQKLKRNQPVVRAAGIPTGRNGRAYTSKEDGGDELGKAFANILTLLEDKKNKFDKVVMSVDRDGNFGSDIYPMSPTMKAYLMTTLTDVVNYANYRLAEA